MKQLTLTAGHPDLQSASCGFLFMLLLLVVPQLLHCHT